MIYAKFLLFALFLSAIPLYGALCRGMRPERLFAAGLLFNGLVFYFFCAARACGIGFCVLFAGNLALYVPVLLKLRRDRGAIRAFSTPAVAVFHAALGIAFLTAAREHLLLWDEYSHWGTAAKFLLEHGVLNCAEDRLLEHASYPPGLPVLYALVHKCFVGEAFRDFLPRFAARALLLGIAILPFGDAAKRPSWRWCAAGVLTFLCAATSFFPGGAWSCESDCLLGCVFAAAVYTVMRHDGGRRDDLLLALLLAWLFLIKKAGMGFAVMVLGLYAVRRIADLRAGMPRRGLWSALAAAAAPFAMQLSWSLLLHLYRTRIVFPVAGHSPRRIFMLLGGEGPAYAGEVFSRFMHDFRGFLWLFLAVLAATAIWLRRSGAPPRRPWDLGWFLPVCFALFSTSLLLTYLLVFNENQALRLVSFDRYMQGFLLMPIALLVMLFFSAPPREGTRKIVSSYVTIALLAMYAARNYVRLNVAVGGITARWPRELTEIDARYGKLLRAPGERFIALTRGGGGLYKFILRGEFEDRLIEEFEPVPGPGKTDDDAQIRLTPAELRRRLIDRKARHVLVLNASPELTEHYREVWETPPERPGSAPELFEVTPEGRLRRPTSRN